jgi:acyl-coenzyme A synthetase/AMP-(fatty) acid ligase
VDLEEIRALVKNVPGVVDCAVIALPESGGREHRIGALIEGDNFDMEMIRKTLVDSLEPYAQPRYMKKVERIPMQKNGKYDWPDIVRLLNQ